MRLAISAIIWLAAGSVAAPAQSATDLELARSLASERTRDRAIAQVLASATDRVSLLLSWTKNLRHRWMNLNCMLG